MKISTFILTAVLLLAAASLTAQNSCGTVKDYDGNIYKTVQLGSQCWMAENLRTTHYTDGREIPLGENRSAKVTPFRYYPDNNSSNVSTLGYLYNYSAAAYGISYSKVAGLERGRLCPDGWHVSTHNDWQVLVKYLLDQDKFVCENSSRLYKTHIAKALASQTKWLSSGGDVCNVGFNLSTNNSTGFSAYPTGKFKKGDYTDFGSECYFWTVSESYTENVFVWFLSSDLSDLYRDDFSDKTEYGFSVRCVRDK